MSRENFVIKLSEKTKEGTAVTPVYINPSHMTALRPIKDGTSIEMHGVEVEVVETVEQIQKKGGAYAIFKIVE